MLQSIVQPASPTWNKELICGLRPHLFYCQTFAALLICGATSLTRERVCRLPDLVSSNKSLVSITICILLVINVCMYNLHKSSVSSGSVQQIMTYY
jgi:hypothetical protein